MDRLFREHQKFSKANTREETKEMRIYKDDSVMELAYSEINVGSTPTSPRMALSDYFSAVSCTFDEEVRPPELQLFIYGDIHFHDRYEKDVELDLLVWQLLSPNQDSRALCVNILRMNATIAMGDAFIRDGSYNFCQNCQETTSEQDLAALRFMSRLAKIIIKNSLTKDDVINAQRSLISYYFGRVFKSVTLTWDSKCNLPSVHGYSTSETSLDHYIRMKIDLFKALSHNNLVYGGNYQLVYQALFYYYVVTNGRYFSGFSSRREAIKSYTIPNDCPVVCNSIPRKPNLSLMFIRAILVIMLIKDYSEIKETPIYQQQLELEDPARNACLVTDSGIRTELQNEPVTVPVTLPTLPTFSSTKN
ncbi:ORF1 [Mal de Rio Cuarto virus]|uniref:ORF1 n=1 Tax=Mal de Rio Cuarto virus TaxID=185954 RepID=A0PJ19_9REOV|nr:ORF1 [Mal de Rio Cuarto virus]AAY27969.1 ORF1 [Mal de Rio Cuarto virus]